MRSKHDIFVEVVQRLAAQGRPSTDPHGICCRTFESDHVRDPVGWLISKDAWSDDLEKLSVWSGRVMEALQQSDFENVSLIVELRKMHDTALLEEWPAELGRIAGRFDLDTHVIVRAFGTPVAGDSDEQR